MCVVIFLFIRKFCLLFIYIYKTIFWYSKSEECVVAETQEVQKSSQGMFFFF